jgi:OOP family OmpA-OmpF porin
MEVTMFDRAKVVRAFVALLALSVVAGCAEKASPPPKAAAAEPATANAPELVGAWYEIYFDTNSSEINSRGQTIVKTVAYVAANAGPTRVTVIGRTDRVGAPPDNMALSHRRAAAMR